MRGVRACVLLFLIGLLPAVVSAQDKFFTSNGVQIRYVDQGAGEPVVLVHGYTNVIEYNWIATGVLPNLVKDHRVIALDLRGHGKSDKPHDPKAYAELGQDVVRLLDHLHIVRAHIVGYSLGESLRPSFSRRIPIASSRQPWSPHRGGEPGPLKTNVAPRPQLQTSKAECPIDRSSSSQRQPISLRQLREAIRMSSQALVRNNDPLAHAALTRARRDLVVTDSQMAAVQVPALAIVGTADPAAAGVQTLKAVWPTLQVVTVDGATHWGDRGILIRPEFLASLRQFIASHRGASQD